MIPKDSKIFVAGHSGLLGSSLLRRLSEGGYANILTRSHSDLDLRDYREVKRLLDEENPEYILLAAAKVGGISANSDFPADFIYDNLAIQTSVIRAAYESHIKRLIFFGSNCTYPTFGTQPINENRLLTGELESTSSPYAVAKIAGMKMCEAYNKQYGTCFLSVIPPTLYGPNDDFNPETSHVLSALMARYHQSKHAGNNSVTLWGSGTPRREFLYVDDLADACIFLLNKDINILMDTCKNSGWILNVGSGYDVTIMELANSIKSSIGYSGDTFTDTTRPDGTFQKLLDSTRINNLGWYPKMSLEQGIKNTYEWYVNFLDEDKLGYL